MKTMLFTKTMRAFAFCAALLAAMAFSACSDDDDDKDESAPAQVTTDQVFTGKFTTSVPVVPTFTPVVVDNTVTLIWENNEQSLATCKLGAFSLEVNISSDPTAPPMTMAIGEIQISGIECQKAGNAIALSKGEFQCKAGNQDVVGRQLVGELKDGELTLTLQYKPGMTPFDIQSVFVGTAK